MASNRDLKERLGFVRFWVNYMKTHTNSVWSRQQTMLINSVLKTANRDPKLYHKVKERLSIKP